MAGSYNHVVKKDGSLLKSDRVQGMLECTSGDVFECVEEMYGMIWYLAFRLDAYLPNQTEGSVAGLVEDARRNYRMGLQFSPTRRYKDG